MKLRDMTPEFVTAEAAEFIRRAPAYCEEEADDALSELRLDVLRAIAEGHPDPVGLARAAVGQGAARPPRRRHLSVVK